MRIVYPWPTDGREGPTAHMNHDHPSEQGRYDASAGAPSGLGAWLAALGDHWKGAMAVALLAGAAMLAADNPLRQSSQVSFLVAAIAGAPEVTGDTADLVRMLGAAGVSDGQREAAVVAKAERESGIVSVSFTLQRTIDMAEARSVAEKVLKQALDAIAPQVESARRSIEGSIAVRRESLERVSASLGGPAPSAAPTEAQAMLLQQQAALRSEISDSERRLAGIRLPAIVGDVRVTAARSSLRAWSAPAAAFAVAFLAAPLVLRSLADARRAVAAARRS